MKDLLSGRTEWPEVKWRQGRLRGSVISLLAIMIVMGLSLLAQASAGGGEAEGGRNWSNFFWRAFDFAVLAGFFYWLLADKVRAFFTGRREGIKNSLDGVAIAREEARKKFAEYDEKLAKAMAEIEEMSEMIKAQGLAEKKRIIADAARTAEKMKDDARRRAEQEMKKARNDLRTEAVRLSVELAQEILRKQITAADHAGLVKDYLDKAVTRT